MPNSTSPTANERLEIDRVAREFAYDDYLAALLAPREQRCDLITIAALFGELARIPLQVSDAALGEIRLQWWRDALASGTRCGHPVADAVIAWQPRLGGRLAAMVAPVIEARSAELYADPFPTDEAFDAYAAAPEMANFALRSALLSLPTASSDETLIAASAKTLGLVRTCTRLPYLFSKGRYPLSIGRLGTSAEQARIDEADLRTAVSGLVAAAATAWSTLRAQLRRTSPALRRVILPVALAGPYLRVIQDVGHDVVRHVADPSPLERSTRLWLAARLGRF